jgi:hypothetical protein
MEIAPFRIVLSRLGPPNAQNLTKSVTIFCNFLGGTLGPTSTIGNHFEVGWISLENPNAIHRSVRR